MDFTLDQKHEMARDLFKQFAETEVKPLAQETDETEVFPAETVAKMGKYGFMGIPVPKEYGGQGCDPLTYVMCVEELSKVCGTTGVIVSAHTSLCIDPIMTFGTEEQKKKYVPDLASGKKIAVEIGKTPVQVNEAAGFVVNRILIPMINEAAFIKMEGVSDIAGIDAAMKLGANHPMGPLELGDFIGLDICLAIMDVLYNETGDSKYRACPLIRKMVRGGNLGAKSGKGFYIYNADRTKTPVDAQ